MENVRMWTEGVGVAPQALTQIRNLAGLPILAGPVAIMPDVHYGEGAVVGSVIPTRKALIPSTVGQDIGCGVCAVRLSLSGGDLPVDCGELQAAIERRVPIGLHSHSKTLRTLHEGLEGVSLDRRIQAIVARADQVRLLKRARGFDWSRVGTQLGTLGRGNHFIEVCLDEAGAVWIMLHSGSRKAGHTIGVEAVRTAKACAMAMHQALPDRSLAWLVEGSEEFDAYVEGLAWAQDYAQLNRALILHLVRKALEEALCRDVGVAGDVVNCHHNFAQVEEHGGERFWVTRKGATRAAAGERAVIPGSMGTRSYIVEGKGHPDSYASCSHGAGRLMKRSDAKRLFSLADAREQTAGIACRKDEGILDELPGAYKDIDSVMRAQTELVRVEHELRQVVCVKG